MEVKRNEEYTTGFIGSCWVKIQGHSSTFQGLNFMIGTNESFNLKINVLTKIVVSVVDEHMHGFKFVTKLAI